ncbi:sugar kinase [Hwanghaeella grinnelliae]|uniref:Sugar kinase n=2 Tax=Hwanghaeella grinnelliae TaxID=2500179 RepID=A0A437QL66_9PROT|nr:sugar kinase [Hwanghaeella grinnelliae]
MIELSETGDKVSTLGGGSLMARTFGGDSLNTAVYAARTLGGNGRVHYATGLGDDPFSDEMLAAWQSEGLATDLVLRFPGRLPGLYAIKTDQAGERSFLYWRSNAPAREVFDHPSGGEWAGAMMQADLLYFSGISLAILDDAGREALLSIASSIREAGGHAAFDTNHRPALWPDKASAATWMAKAFECCTIGLPSLEDARALGFGTAPAAVAEKCKSWGVEEIVVKDGAGPCLVSLPGQPDVFVEGNVVAKPVDTTAAGDSFNGAYLAHRLMGEDPVSSARHGRAMAAWVVGHRGAIVPPMPLADSQMNGGRHG